MARSWTASAASMPGSQEEATWSSPTEGTGCSVLQAGWGSAGAVPALADVSGSARGPRWAFGTLGVADLL